MEEESYDVFPDENDLEMRARLSESEPFRFGLRGITRPESSFMLFVKRRATRDFVGFIDATTMAPVTSYQNRGVRVLNAVINPPLDEKYQSLQHRPEEQLKYLNHSKFGDPATKLLLTETLPHQDYERNLSTIADCLSADNPAVRHDAASRLERLVIASDHRDLQAGKTHLLAVAQKSYMMVSDTDGAVGPYSEDKQHIRMCGHLHLLAMSALLCRVQYYPTLEECRPFMAKPKVSRKQTGEDVRQEVMRTLHAFYEYVERHLKEWKSKATVTVANDKRFFKASFCEQLSSQFLVLNQLATEEWSDRGLELLTQLRDLCDVMSKEGKRMKQETKAGLDTLLIRGLVIILNSTFAKVRQQVGEGDLEHPLIAANILGSLVKRLGEDQLQDLLPFLSTVAFHENPEVRQVIWELLEHFHRPALHSVVNHLEAALSVADFHVTHLPAEKSEETERCQWHTLKGRFGAKPADCHVLVHSARCQISTEAASAQCMQGRENETWGQYKNNLEMLGKLSPYRHLLQLMAFQLSPYFFYATETVKGHRLLEHLINHRLAHRWLDTSILSRVMHDVVSGLEYLANHNIASRDVTTYDMLVSGRSRRGGATGEKTDILTTNDFTIKLTSLAMAHQFREDSLSTTSKKQQIIPVVEQGPIPVLWTSPEALLRGEYGEQSMVYSVGCVMYEAWTHGCQPFTTYQTSTADTVRMKLLNPRSTLLIKWPCIPDDVFDIMARCTSPQLHVRPGLPALKQTFLEMHTRRTNEDHVRRFQMDGNQQSYPSFSDDQMKRKHVPERGIPPDVRQVIEDTNKSKADSYRNVRMSRWEDYTSSRSLAAEAGSELNSPYWIQIYYYENYTSVRERVTPSFVQNELEFFQTAAAQEQCKFSGLMDWLEDQDNKPRLEKESRDHIVHERRYKPSWTLLDTAWKGMLATSESGYFAMSMDRHVHVLLSLARAVHQLHKAGWLHRDIRASGVLVDCATGQVTLARLGRVCLVSSPKDYVVDEPFEDSWRWLAPEVLTKGMYTKQSDVFMLGTVFWEIFWCREITERDPISDEISFLPFAHTAKDDVLNLVLENEPLPKPNACPDWLYQLSINCRHSDPAKRPNTEEIVAILQNEFTHSIDPQRSFLPHPKLLSLSKAGSTVHECLQDCMINDSCDDPSDRGKHPVSVSSIRLDISNTVYDPPAPHSFKGNTAEYLTPVEVNSAHKSRQTPSADRGHRPRHFSEDDAFQPMLQQRAERSFSEGQLPPQLGLILNKGATVRPIVQRRIPGLETQPRRQQSRLSKFREGPLPPLPTDDDDDDEINVYHEIKDIRQKSPHGQTL